MSQRVRKTIIVITGAICLVYLIYRGLFTLNLSSSYAVFASLFLYGAEIYGVTVVLLFFLQVWDTTQPPQQPILPNRTVDVFVPTYNEDPDLLRTTLRACSLMEYPHRTFLCDDGGTDQRCNDKDEAKAAAARARQATIKSICTEFGVTYVTRPANQHAKAGNLNHAFDQTDGEFIIIFDADHVPEPNFITRLLGYFADEKLAWVQTPHAFYNFESFQAVHDHKHNLYWEDGALFYEVIQPGRNRWNAPIFAGSAAMFRRKALAEVGYIATETITEDMHTGLRMHARGWKSLAISERLVAGQAAPDVTTFHTQRLRWGEGNLSIIAHNNPLTTPGLTIAQRFCYLGSMIHWSGGLFKLGIYLTPLLMLFTGTPPVNRFTWPLFILTVLYVLASIWGFKLVSHGYGSFWRSELFTMVGFWTQAKGTMRALFMRKLSQFVVTSKRGRQSKSLWPFIRPHTYFVLISLVALFWGWYRPVSGISDDFFKPIVASCWAIFHTALAVTAIRRSLWPEDRRYSYRHTLHLPAEFGDADEYIARGLGCTTDLSENGIGLILYQAVPIGKEVRVRVFGGPEPLDCTGNVIRCIELSRDPHGVLQEGGGFRVGIKFDELPPKAFDAINRIALHYAVPRLYEQYHSTIPTWMRKITGRVKRFGKSNRHEIRYPFRLPLVLEEDVTPEMTSATEDVSREAMATILPIQLHVGSAREFQLHSPVGVIHGQAEVMAVSPRVYAARTYYRTVFGFTHFHGQGRAIFDDLLAPSVQRVHGPALVPMKKPLPVPMARRVAYAVGVFFVPILIATAVWFHVRMRDDMFLRDVVASTSQVSPQDFERVEQIYSDTVAERNPPTDRLVLLVGALGKSGRGADADQVTQMLASRDRRNLDLQIANANAHLNARDYSKAKAEYERLLRELQAGQLSDEKRFEMQLALARSSFHSGDIDGAASQFKDLIQNRPNDLNLRYEFAGILLNARKLSEAARTYDGVVPDRQGRLLLATVFTLALQPDEADRHLDILLKSNPADTEAQLLKADVLSARNSNVQAEAIYSRLQKLNPGDPGIRSRLGFIALGSRKYDQALALFQQLVDEGSAQPQDVRGFVDAASAATALGDSQKTTAVALVDRALVDWADNPTYLARLAWVLRRVKTTDRELELLERAASIDRGATPDITRQFVGALVESKQWDRALPLVEQAERTPETRATLAGIYLEKKRYADAERECRAILLEKTDDAGARDLLASVYSATGRHKEAVEILQALAREKPADPDLPIRVAEALLAGGDAAGALARYTAGLEADFTRQRLWDGFTDSAAALRSLPTGTLAMAKRLAERGIAGEFKRIESLSRLAWVLWENGERVLAPKLLDRALAKPPTDPDSRIELAGVLATTGRNKEALSMYDGVPNNRRDPFQLIPLYAALRDWPASEKLCWTAIERDPDNRRAWRWLADVLSWKGDHARSLEWFEKLAKANPDDANVRFRMAEVRMWSGDAATAIAIFNTLLERSFEQPRVWNGFLAAAGRVPLSPAHTKMVARIRERASASDSTSEKLRADSVFLAHLGRAVVKSGNEADGNQLLAQAIALEPRDPAVRRELAGILAGGGRYREARKLYEGLILDVEDRFGLIAICTAGMDFDEAKKECLEILKLEPVSHRAKRLLADVTSWKGDHAEALTLFRNLIQEYPNDLDARIRLAEVTLWSKNPAEALKLFQGLPPATLERMQVRRGLVDAAAALDEKARSQIDSRILAAAANRALGESDTLGSDPVHLARLGIVLVRIGEKGQAMRILDRALTLKSTEPAARIELGGAMQVAERFDDAIRLYEGLELSSDSRFRRVEAYSALKKFDLAHSEAEKLVRGRSDDLEARRWLADVRSWKGDYPQAIRDFRELAKLHPNDRDVPVRLAEVTLWSGDGASAVELFQALPDSVLDDAKIRRAYIDAVAGLAPDSPTKPLPAKTLRSAELSLRPGDLLASDLIALSRLAIGLVHSGEVGASGRVLDRALTLPATSPAIRLELGGALVAGGRFADALRMYDGLTLDKENRFRKVELFAAQKLWPEALAECRAVIARDSKDLDAQRRLADLLSWKGDFAESIQLFTNLVQLLPTDINALVRLAEVTLWAKEPAKAFVLFDRLPEAAFARPEVRRGYIDSAAAIPPDVGAKANRARIVAVAQKSQTAGDKLATDITFLARLGLALYRVGEKEQAIQVLERAADLPTTDPAVRLELGGVLVTVGLHARALRAYEGLDLTGDSRFRRLELLAAQKDWPASVAEAQRLLTRDPTDKMAKRWLADILSWKGDHAEAVTLFQELIKDDPGALDMRLRVVEVLLWSKSYDRALTALVELPVEALDRAEVRRGFIDAASSSEKPLNELTLNRAREVAKRTLRADAADPVRASVPYLARLAWVLIRASDRTSGEDLLNLALAKKPELPADRKELGGVLAAAGRPADALKMFEGLTLEGEDRYRIIGIYSAAKMFERAERQCRDLLAADPKDRRAERWLADVLSWKGDHAESLRLFAKLKQDDPDNPEIPVRIAEVTLWSRDAAKAIEQFEVLLAKNMDQPRLWEGFVAAAAASATLTENQAARVKMVRSAAEKADIKSPPFWANLATIAYRDGSIADAMTLIDKAIALGPRDANDRRVIAGALSNLKRFKESAALYTDFDLDRADRLRLAELHAAAQNFPAAIKQLELLFKEDPGDKKVQRYLADVLSWNKDYAASIDRFAVLLKDDPRNPELLRRLAEVKLWNRAADEALAGFVALMATDNSNPVLIADFVNAAAGAKTLTSVHGRMAAQIAAQLELPTLKVLATDAVFLARLALVLHRANQMEVRDRVIAKMLLIPPSTPEDRRDIAGMLTAMRANKQAIAQFVGLELTLADRLTLIDLYAADRQFAVAEREARALREAHPNDNKVLRKLAMALGANQKHGEALAILRELRRAAPEDAELETDLALVTLWAGEAEESMKLLQPLLAKGDERVVTAYLDAAAIVPKLDATAHRKAVANIFDRAAKLTLTNEKRRQLAWVLRRVGEKERGVAILETILAADPTANDVRLELAQGLDDMGKKEAAAEHYRILLDPRLVPKTKP